MKRYHLLILLYYLFILSKKTYQEGETTISNVEDSDSHLQQQSTTEDEPEPQSKSSNEVTLIHFGNMRLIFDDLKLPKDQEGTLTRLHDFLETERSLKKNVYLFNVGNSNVETFLHKALSFHILSQIMNLLKPDATTVGAKSFMGAHEEIFEFIKKSNQTFLSCNTNNLTNFLPYKIIQLKHDNDVNLVVIGYISMIINDLKIPILASDPIKSIKDTLKKIDKEKKIKNKIIIILGWSHDDLEEKMAKEIPEIDLIIGETSVVEKYPIEIKQKSKSTFILKTFKKYLGVFNFTINNEGKIATFKSGLTNMTFHNENSKKLSQMLKVFKPVMDKYDGEIIAKARVNFNPQCKRYECNLGNLITDAFVEYKASIYKGPYWTDTAIAIVNAGSIMEGINLDMKNGEITRADIMEVLPRKEYLVTLTITGENLYNILEQGMKNWETQDDKGSFLQISGLHIICNKTMPPGNRIQFIRARCAKCVVPSYDPVDPKAEYNIVTNEFLAKGGDDYKLLKEGKNHVYESITDVDAVMQYIQEHRVITTEVNERIGSIVLLEGNFYRPNCYVVMILCVIIYFI
ncbi:snake venom 5'-nucleotidase-like [Onthophagus taurus]|uniref:snake venom 5'-nucleotidase-like n=1 Tax=Onthophagus taurus TaxID=166361 RepID=UPI0039BDE258